jgi:hypothetical protein
MKCFDQESWIGLIREFFEKFEEVLNGDLVLKHEQVQVETKNVILPYSSTVNTSLSTKSVA